MEQTQFNLLILTTLKQELNSLHKLLKTQLNPHIQTTKLYDAAIQGDLNSLHNLLQEDPFILHRCIFENSDRLMQSPLHIAVNLGHLEFTTEILRLKPDLAKQVDLITRSTALHLATEKGHLDIVKKLIEVNPNMCLVRDQDGRNPAHAAAINNQLDVLDFLVRMNPKAAQEKTNVGQTLLHLCVKFSQLEPLKYSLNVLGELLNDKDDDGNTVLHLAVLSKQPQAVQVLVAHKKLQRNTTNKNGLTAREYVIQSVKSKNQDEILQTLKRAKALRAKHVEKQNNRRGKWLDKKRNSLMVVASLIATMAFQVTASPPTWNDDPDMVYLERLMVANTLSLVSSLSVMLLLIGGLPNKPLFVFVLMTTMWVATTATLFVYLLLLSRVTVFGASIIVGFSWAILITALVFGHMLRLLIKPLKMLGTMVKKFRGIFVLGACCSWLVLAKETFQLLSESTTKSTSQVAYILLPLLLSLVM